jgi:hypothetical protein
MTRVRLELVDTQRQRRRMLWGLGCFVLPFTVAYTAALGWFAFDLVNRADEASGRIVTAERVLYGAFALVGLVEVFRMLRLFVRMWREYHARKRLDR